MVCDFCRDFISRVRHPVNPSMVDQNVIDNAVVAFETHSTDSFSTILKAMTEAVKGSDSPGEAIRAAFLVILNITYEDGDDDKPDDKVLSEMALLSADGVIEDIVDAILSEANQKKIKEWISGVVRRVFSKLCFTSVTKP
jgi:hypothetical protein